jgi:hypothetical protein
LAMIMIWTLRHKGNNSVPFAVLVVVYFEIIH